ncbi:MAG: tyrosine-protein phosphatase [Planctomycetota bacterium]
MQRILFVTLLAFSAGCVNFHAVEPDRVYRVSQPKPEQLDHWIWRHGIKTVLRLRGGEPGLPEFDASYIPTVKAGIDFVQIPMSVQRFPPRETLMQLCEVFRTAEYPILMHCKAGADRTGLASAIYVLHTQGDLTRAREQLSLRYLHTGIGKAGKLDVVLDLYDPWQDRMTFCEWSREVYEPPPGDLVTPEYLERMGVPPKAD